MRRLLCLVCATAAITAGLAVRPGGALGANGWETAFTALSPGNHISDGVDTSGTVYNAHYHFTVTSRDGVPGNFGFGDYASFTVENVYTHERLSFAGGSRDQLDDWAKQNADGLYRIVYMGSPERSIAGESISSPLAALALDRVFKIPNNDIRVSAQYDFFIVGPGKIETNGPSGVISYVSVRGDSGRHAVGIEVPYRALTAEDNFDTSLVYVLLSPFYEYSFTSGPQRFCWTLSANAGATAIDSTLFGGTTGFVHYGGTLAAGAARTLTRRLEARLGVAYQYLQRKVPEDLRPDAFDWIATAINNADAEQTLTPALGLTAWLSRETASFDANAYYVRQLGADVPDEFREQTIVNGFVTLTPGHWQLRLGYKTSFGLKDFTDRSVVASIRYLW